MALLSMQSFQPEEMIVTLKEGRSRESAGARGHIYPGHRAQSLVRKTWSAKPGPRKSDFLSGDLGYIGRLRPFLSLDNLKLHLVALLQALVAFGGDGAVVNEYIGSFVTAEEAVSFSVVEPFDGAFQSFHVRPAFLRISPKRRNSRDPQKMCRNCAAHRWGCQGLASHSRGRCHDRGQDRGVTEWL